MNEKSEESIDGKYLVRGGSFSDIDTLRCVDDKDEFRLDPVPLSTAQLVVMNSLFAMFFLGLFWLCCSKNSSFACLSVLATWLFTSTCYTLVTRYRHKTAEALGPALVFHKHSGRIVLPRCGQEFQSGDDVWIECLTGRYENDKHNDAHSQLNFVLQRNQNVQRWQIVSTSATVMPFNGMVREIKKRTSIRVVRISGSPY